MTCLTLTLHLANTGADRVDEDTICELRLSAVQSPIPIEKEKSTPFNGLKPLKFDGHWTKLGTATVTNTGETAFITFDGLPRIPTIEGGPLKNPYALEQLHFHWSSDDCSGTEHQVDGQKFCMEAHAVHYNTKYGSFKDAATQPNGLAVVAIMLQVSNEDNELFKPLSQAVDKVQKRNSSVNINTDCLRWIQGAASPSHYYTYRGSLTTPPYLETVTWIVYDKPVKVSKKQVEVFRQLESSKISDGGLAPIINNVRPLQQPKAGHKVIFVNGHKNEPHPKLRSKL